MDERERARKIRQAIDARLSGAAPDPGLRARVLREVRGEYKVKKKIPAGLVLALGILLLAATACAAAVRYGIMDYNRRYAENEAYQEHILQIDETHENDFVTLTVNEAVFDGTSFSMTMNIEPKEGAGEVYIMPRVTAMAGDRALDVDIEGCSGGDFFSGFFVPGLGEMSRNDGCYGADYAILTEGEDGLVLDTEEEPVTWTVTFDILRPEYPVREVETMLGGDDTDIPYEVYMAQFSDAYACGEILLVYGSPVEYASVLPVPEGMSRDAWYSLHIEDRLAASDAFTRVEKLTISFTTGENRVHALSEPQTFDLGEDYEVTVTACSATFARADYRLTLRKKEGHGKSAAAEYMENDGFWEFAVLSSGGKTTPSGDGCGVETDEDGNPLDCVMYSGTVELDRPTDALIFVPCWNDASEEGANAARPVYDAQEPLDERQRDLSFTVKLQ